MPTRDELLRDGLRYDPAERRKSSRRTPGEKGVWLFIPSKELRIAGIDPDGPPPEYKITTRERGRGSMFLRFYR